jgi:hypothetical protein
MLPPIRSVVNVAELRTLSRQELVGLKGLELQGYYAAGDGGGGMLYVDPADTTSADDGGSVFVVNGVRIKRPGTSCDVRQFGAKADGTTDDQPAFQAAVNWIRAGDFRPPLRVPAGNYRLGSFVDVTSTVSARRVSVIGDGSRITRLAVDGNFPGLVVSGTYQNIRGLRIEYPTQRTFSEPDTASILMVAANNTNTFGCYWSSFDDLWLVKGCWGMHMVQGSSGWTITSTALAGANQVVLSAIGDSFATYAVVGAYIDIYQDGGSILTAQITARSGNTVTLDRPLALQASSGNTAVIPSCSEFSNSFETIICENNPGAWVFGGGSGTGSTWNNLYGRNGSQQVTWNDAKYGFYFKYKAQNVFNQINVEAGNFEIAGLYLEVCSGITINVLHTEGVKLSTTNGSILRVNAGPLVVNTWEIRSFETVGAITTGLIRTGNLEFGELYPWPADVVINGLSILGSKIDPLTTAVWVLDSSSAAASVRIKNLAYRSNAGMRRSSVVGAMVAPSTSAQVLRELGDLIPAGVDGAVLGHALNFANDGRIGVYHPGTRLGFATFSNPSTSLSSAQVGLYSGAAASGTEYLPQSRISQLTAKDVVLDKELVNNSASINPSTLYVRTLANQANVTVVSAASATYQRMAGSTAYRGLIKWTTTAPHGLSDRNVLAVSGAVSVPEVNGQQEVVFVESTTIFYTYRWTGYTSSANEAAVTEAVTITLYPSVDVFLRADSPRYLKHSSASSFPYSIPEGVRAVFVGGSGARSVVLPRADTQRFREIVVKDVAGNAGAGTITVTVESALGTIDGSASATITTNYGSLKFKSDNSNWFLVP